LLGKDDLRELDKLKSKMGFSNSFFENLKDLFKVISKVLISFFVVFYRRVFKTQTRGFIFFLVLIFAVSLNYLKWQDHKEIVSGTEIEALDSRMKTASGKSVSEIHTLQVAASTSSKHAHRLIANLKKKGVRNVYQVKTKRKSGETWYKIRVGRFDSKENARRFADQLINKKTIKNYFIISFPVNN
jgi:signal transduction histidine kinase